MRRIAQALSIVGVLAAPALPKAHAQVNWNYGNPVVFPTHWTTPRLVARPFVARPMFAQPRYVPAGRRAFRPRARRTSPSSRSGLQTYTVAVENLGPGFTNTWVFKGSVNASQIINRGRSKLGQRVVQTTVVRSSGNLRKRIAPNHYTELSQMDYGRPLYNTGIIR